jgi:Domain of unknown function (DUF4406)
MFEIDENPNLEPKSTITFTGYNHDWEAFQRAVEKVSASAQASCESICESIREAIANLPPYAKPNRGAPLVIYVAGEYSGDVSSNIEQARLVSAEIYLRGHYPLLRPLINTAYMDEVTGILDIEFWYAATMELLKRCNGVVMVPGWESSKDAVAQRALAIAYLLPVWEYPNLPPAVSEPA